MYSSFSYKNNRTNGIALVFWTKSCREESIEHGADDEISEKTSPQKSLEEEYLETEKKVLF
jgi:hypothetical protein